MRPRLRPLALLVGVALAAALFVLAPRIVDAAPTGTPDAAASVRDAGGAVTEAVHRTGGTTPERALLLLAVLALAAVAVALPGHPLTPLPGAVVLRPVPLARAGVRGPPPPTRSTVR